MGTRGMTEGGRLEGCTPTRATTRRSSGGGGTPTAAHTRTLWALVLVAVHHRRDGGLVRLRRQHLRVRQALHTAARKYTAIVEERWAGVACTGAPLVEGTVRAPAACSHRVLRRNSDASRTSSLGFVFAFPRAARGAARDAASAALSKRTERSAAPNSFMASSFSRRAAAWIALKSMASLRMRASTSAPQTSAWGVAAPHNQYYRAKAAA